MQVRLAHSKHGITGMSLFLHQKDGCKRWERKSYKQIFTREENLVKHLKEARCT